MSTTRQGAVAINSLSASQAVPIPLFALFTGLLFRKCLASTHFGRTVADTFNTLHPPGGGVPTRPMMSRATTFTFASLDPAPSPDVRNRRGT